ncbi:hypothetical protein HOP50_06g44520 [Chloropicon primus]|nr:hypothetical protein HOP50_06g44520 [Chloropicon primus]
MESHEAKLLGIVRELMEADLKFNPNDKEAVHRVVEAIFRARSRNAEGGEQREGIGQGSKHGTATEDKVASTPPPPGKTRLRNLMRSGGEGRKSKATRRSKGDNVYGVKHADSGVKKVTGRPKAGEGDEKLVRRKLQESPRKNVSAAQSSGGEVGDALVQNLNFQADKLKQDKGVLKHMVELAKAHKPRQQQQDKIPTLVSERERARKNPGKEAATSLPLPFDHHLRREKAPQRPLLQPRTQAAANAGLDLSAVWKFMQDRQSANEAAAKASQGRSPAGNAKGVTVPPGTMLQNTLMGRAAESAAAAASVAYLPRFQNQSLKMKTPKEQRMIDHLNNMLNNRKRKPDYGQNNIFRDSLSAAPSVLNTDLNTGLSQHQQLRAVLHQSLGSMEAPNIPVRGQHHTAASAYGTQGLAIPQQSVYQHLPGTQHVVQVQQPMNIKNIIESAIRNQRQQGKHRK